MKELKKTQALDDLFQNDRIEKYQMENLKGGDGPTGDQDLGDDEPPVLLP